MNRLAIAAAVAALATTTPVAAQDIAGPVAAAVDQFGQSMAESMTGGPGLFVTAQGEAPMPAAASTPMTVTIKGTGQTAVAAVADRNAQLERVRSVANRFDVAMDVGATNYSIGETTPAWLSGDAPMADIDWDDPDAAAAGIDAAAGETDPRTVTASVQVKLDRPNESRLPEFVDALVDAGVSNLDDSLNGLNLGAMTPFLSLLGLDGARDPGEAVWNQATADGVRKARAQAETIAEASGRRLGPVRYVSVLMRSHDGENALVSVAVRFGFEE
ncbi:MAG: SIMPL domain-containing protein [Brevundimonas sp.]|uniref:SIMPL domain-containing protein n=1 Tax=Brevundimonas sp. TaxID=1871086 RepID=UPI002627862C|nr:SIMPL domain-containing protein [Brevundimonas sp.]MDI6623419.1 SIMPL domain-containing protein [Brevundimonas sp.]MDQ7811484.1 SIMPL domain-containing protein [Brevundimonas sp.]